MTTLFDLTTQNIEEIAIKPIYGGSNCAVVRIEDINVVYDGFIIRNGPQAQTICNVSFIPSSISGKFVPRLEFKVVYTLNGQIKTTSHKDVRISFLNSEDGYPEFWKMINFLSGFNDLVDTGDFKTNYQVVDSSAYYVAFKSKNEAEQAKELSKFVKEANVSELTIKKALNDKRLETLITFNKLLNESGYQATYGSLHNIIEQGEEAIWHHFLKSNPWIMGLTLDIRFIRDFYDEARVGIEDTTGKGSPHSDLIGIRDYTVLVELKTSNTHIFSDSPKSTARTGSWSFSNYFIDGISQCLSQKAKWDAHGQKELVNPDTKEVVDQNLIRTADCKIIFIIGNKSNEFPEVSKITDIHKKRDTFELFRRNNRNIEIITFDELYERAYFIVHGVRL